MKSKTKLLFIVVAIIMLFAITEVEALCPEETCTIGPWTMEFGGMTPADCVNGNGESVPCYKYTYIFTSGPTSGLNQISALIPVCCGNNTITTYLVNCDSVEPDANCAYGLENGDFRKYYAPGAGDVTTGFGKYIGMDYVVRSEPTGGILPTINLFSSSPMAGITTMQIKSGSKLYYCSNIVGPRCPDCGKEAHIPSVVEKLIYVESGCVKLSISSDRCVQSLSLCDANCANCVPQQAVYLTTTSDDDRIIGETLREISDTDGNQRCAWGRLYIGDHTCQSVPSGTPGKYFLWGDTCKCTSTSQCYPPKKCVLGRCQ